MEGQQVFDLRLPGELIVTFEAGVDGGQPVRFVVNAVIGVYRNSAG